MKITKALPIAILIVAVIATVVVGSEIAFGITTGWLLVVCISLFMGMTTIPTKEKWKRFFWGSLYGIIIGQFFALFVPIFALGVVVLITCKLMNKFPTVLNDYALVFLGVYAIGGVAKPAAVWQDFLLFGITALLIFAICTIIEKKVMGDMTKTPQRKELSAEEKAKPYAKYYYRDLTPPSAENLAALKKPLKPEEAMPITELSRLFQKDTPYPDSGYCVMPDGSGYVAARTFMPGVTPEMMNWWLKWHAEEDLRYKIWYYPGHASVKDITPQEKHAETAMQKVVGKEAFGNEYQMVEDIGMGYDNVFIHFMTPEEAGIDVEALEKSEISYFSIGNGATWGRKPNSAKTPAVVCHVGYETDGGMIYQSHFWMGWEFFQGEPHLVMSPGGEIPIFGPKGMYHHCISEFANLAAFLPQIYEEEKNRE